MVSLMCVFKDIVATRATKLQFFTRALHGFSNVDVKKNALSLSSRSFSAEGKGDGRTFHILGLQQIALGSLEKSPLQELWQDMFGLTKVGSYKNENENVDEDILLLGKPDSPFVVEVDLMAPLNKDKSPRVHVPPLNHIGLWVDNIDAAVGYLEKRGVRFTAGGIRKGASGHKVTFIHPHSGCGALIELVQAPPEVIAAMKRT